MVSHLWPGPISPALPHDCGSYDDAPDNPIKIGGWEAHMTEGKDARGIWHRHWIITAPNGNSVLEVPDVERWQDLHDLANFILAATTEARRVEEL